MNLVSKDDQRVILEYAGTEKTYDVVDAVLASSLGLSTGDSTFYLWGFLRTGDTFKVTYLTEEAWKNPPDADPGTKFLIKLEKDNSG